MDQEKNAVRSRSELEAEALAALEEARTTSPGPERTEAMKKAGMPRNAADLQGVFLRGAEARENLAACRDVRQAPATSSNDRPPPASKILECAKSGEKTLGRLTEARRVAATDSVQRMAVEECRFTHARAEIAHVLPDAAIASIFGAGYHNAAIRTERHKHCLRKGGDWFLTFRSVANETHHVWSDR